MRIAVTGSIATDHLMTFDGRFADCLVVEQLHKISLSFLVDDLQIRRGGVAANIAFGLAALGQRPLLVGAVGEDFVDYRSWLERHGVDCSGVHVSRAPPHRPVRLHDRPRPGADRVLLRRGDERGPRDRARPAGGGRVLDLVLVGPNDPEAMLRHTEECRTRGSPSRPTRPSSSPGRTVRTIRP